MQIKLMSEMVYTVKNVVVQLIKAVVKVNNVQFRNQILSKYIE